MKQHPELEQLSLRNETKESDMSFHQDTVDIIFSFPNLKRFDSYLRCVNMGNFDVPPYLPHLEHIGGDIINQDSLIQFMAAAPNLKSISFDGHYHSSSYYQTITEKFLHRLKSVNLDGCLLSDSIVKTVLICCRGAVGM